jgi:hypothetical protein
MCHVQFLENDMCHVQFLENDFYLNALSSFDCVFTPIQFQFEIIFVLQTFMDLFLCVISMMLDVMRYLVEWHLFHHLVKTW